MEAFEISLALGQQFFRVIYYSGLMQEPSIPGALQLGSPLLEVNMRETAFCVSRETLTPARKPGMAA